MNYLFIQINFNFLSDLDLRPDTNNMSTNYDGINRPLHARYDYFWKKYHGDKHTVGVTNSLIIKHSNHIYNKYRTHQIFCNNDNDLGICACGSYKYQEMRIVHCIVQFVSFFFSNNTIEFHLLVKKNHSFNSLQDREAWNNQEDTPHPKRGRRKGLEWRTSQVVTPEYTNHNSSEI